MITEESRKAGAEDQEIVFIPISMHELIDALHKHRRIIALATGIGMLLAFGISFLIPNEYTSTAQLMPPDPQTFATSSAGLATLTGMPLTMPGSVGSLLNQQTPAGTAMGILSSRDVLDDIINRFDLRRTYHCKLYIDARKELLRNTDVQDDRKSGLISIAVTDRDKYTAQQMAEAYIDDLNRLANSLSTSSARRERVFLEGRLSSIKGDLDASSRALSQFSSRNNALDIAKQGQATVEAAEKLQGELISAQSELAGLEAVYTNENVRVQEARRRIEELQSQLQNIAGRTGKAHDAQTGSDGPMPSLRKLPILGVTYYDLSSKVTMEETLYETLSKQYELAKVREAEEIPPIKVLDEPDLPEKRSSPHQSVIVLVAGFLCLVGASIWALLQEHKFTKI